MMENGRIFLLSNNPNYHMHTKTNRFRKRIFKALCLKILLSRLMEVKKRLNTSPCLSQMFLLGRSSIKVFLVLAVRSSQFLRK